MSASRRRKAPSGETAPRAPWLTEAVAALEVVERADDRAQGVRERVEHERLRGLREVEPLPVGVFGGGEAGEGRVRVVDQQAERAGLVVEHGPAPEIGHERAAGRVGEGVGGVGQEKNAFAAGEGGSGGGIEGAGEDDGGVLGDG